MKHYFLLVAIFNYYFYVSAMDQRVNANRKCIHISMSEDVEEFFGWMGLSIENLPDEQKEMWERIQLDPCLKCQEENQ